LSVLVFPFFILSDSLGICWHLLFQCPAIYAIYFSGICHFMFLENLPLFSLFSFLLSEPGPISANVFISYL
jgi:hypothetical protein